jgi:chromosome segregation ATPase
MCSVAFINLAVTQPNWKHAYDASQKEAAQNRADVRFNTLAFQTAKQENDALRKASTDTRTVDDGKIADLSTQLATAQAANAKLQGDVTTITGQISILVANDKQYLEQVAQLRTQLEENRQSIAKLSEDNRRVTDLQKKTQSDLENAEGINRQLRGQVAQLDEENGELQKTVEDMKRGLATGGTAPVAEAGAAQKINATITAVRGNLASINVGSAQGVKSDMKMYVYRVENGKTTFVCNLLISNPEPGEAAGVIMDKVSEPRQGDKATNILK